MDKVLVVLAAIISLVAAEADNCPTTYPHTTEVHRRGEYCYQFVHRETYWSAARDYCREYNGHLVRIDDAETNEWLIRKLNKLWWGNKGVWIGLHDIDDELNWMWVTQDKSLHVPLSSWSNWGPGHPGAFLHTRRDCVRMVRGDNWEWHETFCDVLNWKYRFICQYAIPRSSGGDTGMLLGNRDTSTTSTTKLTTTDQDKELKIYDTGAFDQNQGPDGDQLTKEEEYEEEYYRQFEDRELPIPMARVSGPEKKKTEGVMMGGVMAGLVVIIIVLIILLLVVRRRRQKPADKDPEYTYPENAASPPKKLTVRDPDEQEFRMSNIYVEPPDSDLQSTPLPPPPLPISNPGYDQIDPKVKPKVTVVERNDLENGGSKVKVMISRGKGSSVGYVLPDEVRIPDQRESPVQDVTDQGVVKGDYLCMDGSPKCANKGQRKRSDAQQTHDDEIDGYDRPTSPIKNQPIRALEFDTPTDTPTNGPIRTQEGNVAGYDVPRPEPVYAEIPELPENIYEDLDEHQAKLRESKA